jgi:hypothetical protein
MLTLATPLLSVSAVPLVGEKVANALLVAKLTTEFGTGFLLASRTVALTVSGVAPVSELDEVPLAFRSATVTVGADWLSEGDVVVPGDVGGVDPSIEHKPEIPLTQLSVPLPLLPPPQALNAILATNRTEKALSLIVMIIPLSYLYGLAHQG